MFRAARSRASSPRSAQTFMVGLCCLLLLTTEGIVPAPAQAGAGVAQMAAVRHGQSQASSAMHRADRKIKSLKARKQKSARQFRTARKELKRQIRKRETVRRRLQGAERRYTIVALDRDRTLLVRPNPAGRQVIDRPGLRRKANRLEADYQRLERKVARLERKVQRTRRVKQARTKAIARLSRQIGQRKQQRKRAQVSLGSRVTTMVRLAQRRASQTTRSPAVNGWRRPTHGRVSQGYGCQRRRKGHCAHFHDGIDIATRRGTRVYAAAAGYVAYVGWNPWDKGRRAYIVIIGHAGGYETLYGHLMPVRKVRAGQKVRRGQLIGLVGSTGRSSGPHLHWEVSRGFRTVNPRSVGR